MKTCRIYFAIVMGVHGNKECFLSYTEGLL